MRTTAIMRDLYSFLEPRVTSKYIASPERYAGAYMRARDVGSLMSSSVV